MSSNQLCTVMQQFDLFEAVRTRLGRAHLTEQETAFAYQYLAYLDGCSSTAPALRQAWQLDIVETLDDLITRALLEQNLVGV